MRRKRRKMLIPVAVLAVLAAAVAASAATDLRSAAATPIRVAVLSDCQGAFGAFDGQDMAGVVSAMSEYAGAKPVNPNDPRKGWTGGQINGHPLKLVGVGCSQRPCRHGDQGDQAAHGAVEGRRHDRPAVR